MGKIRSVLNVESIHMGLYATTPGGTRIVWTREQMLKMASSPLSKSPLSLPPELSFLSKDAPFPNEFDQGRGPNHKKPKDKKDRPVDSPKRTPNDAALFEMDL